MRKNGRALLLGMVLLSSLGCWVGDEEVAIESSGWVLPLGRALTVTSESVSRYRALLNVYGVEPDEKTLEDSFTLKLSATGNSQAPFATSLDFRKPLGNYVLQILLYHQADPGDPSDDALLWLGEWEVFLGSSDPVTPGVPKQVLTAGNWPGGDASSVSEITAGADNSDVECASGGSDGNPFTTCGADNFDLVCEPGELRCEPPNSGGRTIAELLICNDVGFGFNLDPCPPADGNSGNGRCNDAMNNCECDDGLTLVTEPARVCQ